MDRVVLGNPQDQGELLLYNAHEKLLIGGLAPADANAALLEALDLLADPQKIAGFIACQASNDDWTFDPLGWLIPSAHASNPCVSYSKEVAFIIHDCFEQAGLLTKAGAIVSYGAHIQGKELIAMKQLVVSAAEDAVYQLYANNPELVGGIGNLLNATHIDDAVNWTADQVIDAVGEENIAAMAAAMANYTPEQLEAAFTNMEIGVLPLGAAGVKVVKKLENLVLERIQIGKSGGEGETETVKYDVDGEAGYGDSIYQEWRNDEGNWIYPPNDGFDGAPVDKIIPEGTILDRYGHNTGSFLAPKGTPFHKRALPPGTLANQEYHIYKVLKPLPIKSGKATPWFNQLGGGVQYKTPHNIQWLLREKYIKKVN